MEENSGKPNLREFGPFVSECKKRGIPRTTAYKLRNDGLIDTFNIGVKPYVYIDSILSLPERLAQEKAA